MSLSHHGMLMSFCGVSFARALVIAGMVVRGWKWWGMLGDLGRKDPPAVTGSCDCEGVRGEEGTWLSRGENDQMRVLTA